MDELRQGERGENSWVVVWGSKNIDILKALMNKGRPLWDKAMGDTLWAGYI